MAKRFRRSWRGQGKMQWPSWLKNIRDTISQFTIPLIIFQVIRTLLFPSGVDLIIIVILLLLHVCFVVEIL
ncbi:hypothetical protein A374_11425 [Fictibacillus macauensis ZFHKF-1]|uniref:Uncharacterized protein n=1 Tax=Fictibacillus macauensis ZFHKF-1 TaxID=1196324 RepID=I8J0R7_9BACL|nr:hypothetical protein [Fictibacillus macauensis]EIT85351.1 hypothetical protein A374_11425 [Fictibacillus macauensis ZFHKF-1]